MPKNNSGNGGGGSSHDRAMARAKGVAAEKPKQDNSEAPEAPRGLWKTLFQGLWKWAILFPVASTAVAYGMGIMSVPWFPHNLFYAQTMFAFSALLFIAGVTHSAIKSESGSIRDRVLFSLIPSMAAVSICTYVIAVIQIHKTQPPPESASVKQGLVNVDGGSSVGTLSQSGNSFVAADPNSGKAAEINNSKLGSFTMQDVHACAGIEDWPCFVLTEKSYINQGNREKFEETASSFNGIVNVRLFRHPELVEECRKEVEKGVKVLRESFETKDDQAIEALTVGYPICLMPKEKEQRK